MKLKFVVKDIAYMRALAFYIEKSDINTFVQIGRDFESSEGVLTVSDISADAFASFDCEAFVFLDDNSETVSSYTSERGPFRIYKYCSASVILSELRLFYSMCFGYSSSLHDSSRVIGIMCDSLSAASVDFAELIARQYVYRLSGSAAVIPLYYVPDPQYVTDCGDRFKRMFYYVDSDRAFPAESFFLKDQYGVYHFMFNYGINPFAGLGCDSLCKVTNYLLSNLFDFVIYDAGCELSEDNIRFMSSLLHTFWLHKSNEDTVLYETLVREVFKDRDNYTPIYIGKDKYRVSMAADDMINKLFLVNSDDKRDS